MIHFVLKMMNFVLKTRNFVFKMMNSAGLDKRWRAGSGNFAFKMTEFVYSMMNFACKTMDCFIKNDGFQGAEGPIYARADRRGGVGGAGA